MTTKPNHLTRLAAITAILLVLSLQSTALELPSAFKWGVATSAYQIEGAWNISGKGPSIWDNFTQYPDRIHGNQNGQDADDFYHRYKEDINMTAQLGINNTIISMSWSRLFPNGTVDGVNQEAVNYYNSVIDTFLDDGIDPWVTIYHWDLPAALDNKTSTGGWLNPDIVRLYNEYADFLFQTFGGRVKYWLTFNEIPEFAWAGYGLGTAAPGRCSPDLGSWCKEVGGGGNSSTEPYIVAHNALLAHANAVNTYRTKYQKLQSGFIGIAIDGVFALPFNPNDPADVKGVDDYMAFKYGWIADPLVFGKYPDVMTQYITGERLPKFTDAESTLLKGSFDFLGLDYFTSRFVRATGTEGSNYGNDMRVEENTKDAFGNEIGPKTGDDSVYVYAPGIRGMLNWIDSRYNHPVIYVMENGVAVPNEYNLPLESILNDTFRIDYLRNHTDNVMLAKDKDKIDVRGYFAWSLLDSFEWANGYDVRYGLVYVDRANNLTRHLKDSATWYAKRINGTSGSVTKEVVRETLREPSFLF